MPDITVAISTVNDGNMYIPDDPTNQQVISNRESYLASKQISLSNVTRVNVAMYQRDVIQKDSDFCRYVIVSDKDKGSGMRDDDVMTADALVTTDPGHALFLPLADCIGTVFYDSTKGILMLSHLGRQSLEQNGAVASVRFLEERFGSKAATLQVWLTPAPSKEAYTIWKLDNKGMKEAIFEQLDAAGISPANITDNPAETDKDPRYFSYTNFVNGRSSDSGRHAIVAMMN